ncbi:MAG: hypothetical protein ABL993_09375 [Vicinamibacterales bacterium]
MACDRRETKTGRFEGALGAVKKAAKAPKAFGPRRGGPVSAVERELVGRFVADQPKAITPAQTKALQQLLHRTPATVKQLIIDAREHFLANGKRYVDIHKEAAEGALLSEDFETAGKLAQYALSNLSAGGERIVEKVENATAPSARIMVGVRIGGVKSPLDGPLTLPIDTEAVPVE